jgi:hypothetical protein
MKTIIILLLIFLLIGCGKKQSDIEIKKFEDRKTETVSDSSKSEQKEKTDLKSGGNTELKKISSKEAAVNISKNALVTGFVADVTIREKVAYLNFDAKFPKNTFSAVIFKDKFEIFGDLAKFKNKTVEVSGVISEYKKKPQIILNVSSQIKIIK